MLGSHAKESTYASAESFVPRAADKAPAVGIAKADGVNEQT